MVRLSSLLFVLISVLALSVSTHGQRLKNSAYLKDAMQLSPAIYDVKGMGNWKKGKQAGQVRLVIARSARQDEIFLQWVSWDSKGPHSIKSTVQIKEIEKMGRYKVSFIRREASNGGRKIILGLENLHDKITSRAIIEVQDVGLYHCQLE